MPIKSIVAEEQEENLRKNLAAGKRLLYEALDKNPVGFCFVVFQKDGQVLRGTSGITGPGMIGCLEMLKLDIAMREKMQEGAENAH